MGNIRMPRELGEKWLAALRSGEYKQTDEYLEDNGSYCCLGVLQVCADGMVETETDGSSFSVPSRKWLKTKEISFYSEDKSFAIPDIGDLGLLTDLNDVFDEEGEHKYPFTKIADLIESEMEYTDD